MGKEAPFRITESDSTLPISDSENPKLSRKARLSGYFTIASSGFALISDGLQNNIMTLTNVVFKQIYTKEYTSVWSTRVSNSLLVGAIIGQLSVGVVCDRFGRKFGIVMTTALIIIGIILVTAAHGANGSVYGFFWFLIIARGITGIGVGGEYPASSTSAAEAANEKAMSKRGGSGLSQISKLWLTAVFILVTNLVLSFGTPLASIIYLIVFEAAGGVNSANLSTVWRTTFGISAIFPATVFYFRLKMLNSKLYQKSAIKRNVPYGLMVRYYWRSLIGTSLAWFLYDFVTFPNGIFSGVIISSVIHETGRELFKKTAEWNLLLGVIALPGCLLGAAVVNKLGRRNLMICGFSGYLLVGLIVGCAYDRVTSNIGAFVFLYGRESQKKLSDGLPCAPQVMQSFGNFGPGNVLGLASSESYATAVRGTCYGFSAAVGKAGAAVGTQAFQPIRDNLGKRWTFIIAACIGVLGMLVTFFFIRNDLGGDLADEDRKFEDYLRANGWTGPFGALDSEVVDNLDMKIAEKANDKM